MISMIDRYETQKQLIEKCKNNYEEAYAIADKKTAELLSLDERTKEQREELYAWNEIRNYLANTLTYKYMKEKGYQTLYHGECCYLEKIKKKG